MRRVFIFLKITFYKLLPLFAVQFIFLLLAFFKQIMKKLFVLLFLISGMAHAQDRPMHELHSMMVFNFLKYIQWPDDTKSGDFSIAVIGDDNVYQTLQKFYSNRKVGSQKVSIENYSSADQVSGSYHLVYLSKNKSKEFDAVLEKFNSKSTLIITNTNGLGSKGSGINFRVVGDRLKFELNQAALTKCNLKVSSQLSNMAILI